MLAAALDLLFKALYFLIIVRVVLSWIGNPYNQFTVFVHDITEPLLAPVRRLLPPMPLDLSPMIVIILLEALRWILFSYVL